MLTIAQLIASLSALPGDKPVTLDLLSGLSGDVIANRVAITDCFPGACTTAATLTLYAATQRGDIAPRVMPPRAGSYGYATRAEYLAANALSLAKRALTIADRDTLSHIIATISRGDTFNPLAFPCGYAPPRALNIAHVAALLDCGFIESPTPNAFVVTLAGYRSANTRNKMHAAKLRKTSTL